MDSNDGNRNERKCSLVDPSMSMSKAQQQLGRARVDNEHCPSSQTDLAEANANNNKSQVYCYCDYAQARDVNHSPADAEQSKFISHHFHNDSLANQKLPAKLGAMLSDPDLIACITWMPHGRSWKILNRILFSSYALPRYFGHTNHASFIRLVNAWGFRRITSGPDRDSYYHELFLRGKSNLHCQMTRCNDTKSKAPAPGKANEIQIDFYQIAKDSPLPDNEWQYRTLSMNHMSLARIEQSFAPPPFAPGMSTGVLGKDTVSGPGTMTKGIQNHDESDNMDMGMGGRAVALTAMASKPSIGETRRGDGLTGTIGGGTVGDEAGAGEDNIDIDSKSGGEREVKGRLSSAAMQPQQNDSTSKAILLEYLVNQNQLLRAMLIHSQNTLTRLRVHADAKAGETGCGERVRNREGAAGGSGAGGGSNDI